MPRSAKELLQRRKARDRWRALNPEDHRTANRLYAKRKREMRQTDYMAWLKRTWSRRRAVAKKRGLSFTVEFDDIVWPTHCPVFGVKLDYSAGNLLNRPTLDRLDSTKGYEKGNVFVISFAANTVKSYGTAKEHAKIALWMFRMEIEQKKLAKTEPGV